ncbi:MAG TPA: ABC transporter substrate-binding protein [Magnetospirillaceae bacterium]|jgi:branched-chain amino acid transport system substrate-binding protein
MRHISRRTFGKTAIAASALIGAPAIIARAADSIRIGFSIAQTGGIASGGKAGLAALEMWRADINGAGGLLGRQVEFVVYDDQSQASTVPGIYAKLLDIDKVDLILAPYGTNLTAVMMPMMKQRDRFVLGQFEIGQNDKLQHDKFFEVAPWGPKPGDNWCRGYFDLAKRQGYKSVVIVNSDAEFSANAAAAGGKIAEEYGMKVLSVQHYTPNAVDFSGILRNVNAANPDFVFVASYPVESAALVHGISEIGIADSVQMFGGAMVGIQYAQQLESLGSALDGIVNYDTYVVAKTMEFPGIAKFLDRYKAIAEKQNIDTLGHFLPPFFYAGGQIIAAAAKATNSIDEAKMSEWLHHNPVDTIVGPIKFGADGNWSENRLVWGQYRGVKDKDVDQFRSEGKQIIVQPEALATGKIEVPYKKARA